MDLSSFTGDSGGGNVIPGYDASTGTYIGQAAAGSSFVPSPSYATSDPSGIGSINPNPAVNPTPTGSWMTSAMGILNSAGKGFSTFVTGSPSAGVPAALRTLTGKQQAGVFTTASGQTNWAMVLAVVALAGGGIFLLVKYA